MYLLSVSVYHLHVMLIASDLCLALSIGVLRYRLVFSSSDLCLALAICIFGTNGSP